jgi:hypothetical protein
VCVCVHIGRGALVISGAIAGTQTPYVMSLNPLCYEPQPPMLCQIIIIILLQILNPKPPMLCQTYHSADAHHHTLSAYIIYMAYLACSEGGGVGGVCIGVRYTHTPPPPGNTSMHYVPTHSAHNYMRCLAGRGWPSSGLRTRNNRVIPLRSPYSACGGTTHASHLVFDSFAVGRSEGGVLAGPVTVFVRRFESILELFGAKGPSL